MSTLQKFKFPLMLIPIDNQNFQENISKEFFDNPDN